MSLFSLFILLFSILIGVQAAYTDILMLYAWEDKKRNALSHVQLPFEKPHFSFTILLPARHEEAVIQDTIQRVVDLNYPWELKQIIVIVEGSDLGTIAQATERISQLRKQGVFNVRLVTYCTLPINKPHGLNVGLSQAKGDIVTIFDAEDAPHKDILQIVNSAMWRKRSNVIQCGVQLMNYADHWFSALNVLEYFFWFKSRMHYYASTGMVPLGGNTVFIKRNLLQRFGGWDQYCLTEDADIGIRLSASGERIDVIYDDRYVTQEETPVSVDQFIRQRTRWNQGFLQVLAKGDWKRLPTGMQQFLALYTLCFPLYQALMMLFIPVSLGAMFFVKLPILVTLISVLPFYMLAGQYVISLIGLYEFTSVHGLRPSLFTPLKLLLTFLPYQWLLSYSALRATWRHSHGINTWEKTTHIGAHRGLSIEPLKKQELIFTPADGEVYG